MPDFLQLTGKTFLVQGVANRKSVAWHVAKSLEEQGARVVYAVRSEARKNPSKACSPANRSSSATSKMKAPLPASPPRSPPPVSPRCTGSFTP